MALEFRPGSTHWTAVLYLPTGKKAFPLKEPIKGQRSAKVSEPGDREFEASRVRAQVEHDELKAKILDPLRAIRAAQTVVEVATQTTQMVPARTAMLESWQNANRRGVTLAQATIDNHRRYFAHFNAFMDLNYKHVVDLRLLNATIVDRWARQLKSDGYLAKTFNNYVGGLSALFCATTVGLGLANPFRAICRVSLKGITAHRKPFTVEELPLIYDACMTDPMVGPLVVVALNTGMRRSDCALLTWADVHLEEACITVIAQKNREQVGIPIFAKLREVLEKQPHKGKYVFPEVAALFTAEKDNRNHVTLRLKKILKVAGIDYDTRNDEFVTNVKRLRKASISGMHAMKTTFVTIALGAGVSESTIKKIVGNEIVEIVLKHYFKPGRELIANNLRTLLPSALTGEKPQATLRDLLMNMDENNWRAVRTQALKLVK